MGNLHRNIQLILQYINDVPDDVICNINQASDLWQQLKLTLNLNLTYKTRKWLFDFNAGKTQLVLFDQSKNTGTIGVKMDRSHIKKKKQF